MKDLPWISVKDERMPENVFCETKIDDENGCRGKQVLFRVKNEYFDAHLFNYISYKPPTHWRHLNFS